MWDKFQKFARSSAKRVADTVAYMLLFDDWVEALHPRGEGGKFTSGQSAGGSHAIGQNASQIGLNASVNVPSIQLKEMQGPAETAPEDTTAAYKEPTLGAEARPDRITAKQVTQAAADIHTLMNVLKQDAHLSRQKAVAATNADQARQNIKQQKRQQKAKANGQQYTPKNIQVPRKSFFTRPLGSIRRQVADMVASGNAILFKNGCGDCQVLTQLDSDVGKAYNTIDGVTTEHDTSAVCAVYSRKDGIHYYPITQEKYDAAEAMYKQW